MKYYLAVLVFCFQFAYFPAKTFAVENNESQKGSESIVEQLLIRIEKLEKRVLFLEGNREASVSKSEVVNKVDNKTKSEKAKSGFLGFKPAEVNSPQEEQAWNEIDDD